MDKTKSCLEGVPAVRQRERQNRLIKQETKWQGANAIAGMPILRIEYKYDAYWRRVEKKVSTWNATTFQQTKLTKFAYDGWNLIAEWEAAPSTLKLARTHHWELDLSGTLTQAGGVGGLMLTRHHSTSSGQTTSYFPAYDGTGNVLALFDTVTGKRAAEYEYGPFGETLRATGLSAINNSIQWNTKCADSETGLAYYGYRYYASYNGRWISRDPVAEYGGSNIYSFVENKPVQSYDILGLQAPHRDGNGRWLGPYGMPEPQPYESPIWDEKANTVTVKKCQVILFLGHGSSTNPVKWNFESECSGGGAWTCFPLTNSPDSNHSIWPHYGDPMPDNDYVGCTPWLPNTGLGDKPVSARNIFKNAYKAFFAAAFGKATSICEDKKKCCEKVSIGSVLNNRRSGSQNPLHFIDFQFTVSCNSPDLVAFNDYVDRWYAEFEKEWEKKKNRFFRY